MRYGETIRAGRLRLALAAGLLAVLAGATSAALAQPAPGHGGGSPAPGAAPPGPRGGGPDARPPGGGPGARPPGGGGHPPPSYRAYPRGDRHDHDHHSSSVIFFGPTFGWGWGYPYYDGFYYGGYNGWPYPPPGGYYERRYEVERREPPAPPVEIFVYPQRGQSEAEQATDRYECHSWGVKQTGFDPVRPLGGVAEADWAAKRDAYQRALTACLSARGYAVR